MSTIRRGTISLKLRHPNSPSCPTLPLPFRGFFKLFPIPRFTHLTWLSFSSNILAFPQFFINNTDATFVIVLPPTAVQNVRQHWSFQWSYFGSSSQDAESVDKTDGDLWSLCSMWCIRALVQFHLLPSIHHHEPKLSSRSVWQKPRHARIGSSSKLRFCRQFSHIC